MKKKEGFLQLAVGLAGAVLCIVLPNGWAYLPALFYGFFAVAMIRRTKEESLSEREKECFRKRNVITLVCWMVFALVGFFFLRNQPVGAEGLWFVLSAYLFLLVHGIAMILPVKKNC